MTVSCISDLHGYLPEIIPGDLLLICGDIIPLEIQFNMPKSEEWFCKEFLSWANNLEYDKILFIAGNHDAWLCRNSKLAREYFPKHGKITYLCNDSYAYIDSLGNNYTIFGTPYCHQFGNWSFMVSDEILRKKFSEIPENLDILITHDAPTLGYVGIIQQSDSWNYGNQCGNYILTEELLKKKPTNVFCGHIHSGLHEFNNVEGINIANVSLVDEHYHLVYDPLTIEL